MDKYSLKHFSQEQADELMKALSKLNVKEAKGEGTFKVIATTEGVDRDGEVIMIDGWDFDNFMKNPVVLFGHNYWDYPVGAVTNLSVQDGKVIAEGVFARTEEGQKARLLYEDGILKTVSVGFIPKERTGNVITKAELLELSFVPVPSNPEAVDARKEPTKEMVAVKEFENMLKTSVQVKKDVVPFKSFELAPEDQEWDADAAKAAVKEWATGEDGEIDFDKYKQAFTWYDGDKPELQGSYKLPHHTVAGDQLQTVWRGVAAAMGALLGAQGGVDIPESERQGVYDHLAKHYEEFDKEPPEFKSYTPYELKRLFPELHPEIDDGQKAAINTIVKTLKQDVQCLVEDAVEKIESSLGEIKEDAEPTTKAGRTLSRKTRATVNNAVVAMGKAIEDLTALLESSDVSEDDGKDAELATVLKSLQGLDKSVERAIKTVKISIKN